MDSFLSLSVAGIAAATAVSVLGILLVLAFRRARMVLRWAGRVLGSLLIVLSIVTFAGAIAQQRHLSRTLKRFPPPGKLVDIGGRAMHLWCLGPEVSKEYGQVTIVWHSGGLAEGAWLSHLHRAAAKEIRTCVYDRAGTGWSDPAPQPRRLREEIEDLDRLLQAGGERPPYVMIGHSLGAVIAANYANRFRNNVAGLVALDGTPPNTVMLNRDRWCAGAAGRARAMALATSLGAAALFPALQPMNRPQAKADNRPIADMWDAMTAWETRSSALVQTSIYMQVCSDPYGIVRSPGALGDLPLLSITQKLRPLDPKHNEIRRTSLGVSEEELPAVQLMEQAGQREYLQYSSRSELVEAPENLTHNFPMEAPEFVLREVFGFLGSLRTRSGDVPAK